MEKIAVGAFTVSPSEPAFNLSEMNLKAPGKLGVRRYRVVSVIRGDRLAEHFEDLGPADTFTASEFRIPGGVWDGKHAEILHTVEELRSIADDMQHTTPPTFQSRDLVEEFISNREQRTQLIKERGL